MEQIDVEGLPPEVLHALRAMIAALKAELRKDRERPGREVRPLPEWPGDVIRPVTREDIYSDAGRT